MENSVDPDKMASENKPADQDLVFSKMESTGPPPPPPPPPRDQTNPFAYSCGFTLNTSYKNGMGGGGGEGGGGTMSKRSKTIHYKNLLGTYFVQTCR